jgi:biopolymer transport protein ExbB
MLHDIYIAIIAFMDQGGNVLWYIAVLTFVMWTLIVERTWYFVFDHKRVVAAAIAEWEGRTERRSWSAHQIRNAMVSESASKIQGTLPLIQTCVMLCPLLGLLGTVTGMVTVFDAMATVGGNARSMAAGVSMATIPTMAGMIASLSGLVTATLIKNKVTFETELLGDHLTMDH